MKQPIKKKTKKLPPKKETRFAERARFKKVVNGLSKTRNGLEKTIRQRSAELKIKNGQLKQQIQQRHLAEAQMHICTQAMESAADGIFIIDAQAADFPLVYVNQSFQKMVGRADKDIIGRGYLLFYGDDVDSRILKRVEQAIRGGRVFQGEMLTYRENGEKLWALLRIAPVRDTNGVITHFIGVQTDTTQMKQEEVEIKKQREELLHVSRVGKLGELVSSLAHEINQPLAAILSYTQAALRMTAAKDPKLQEILRYIVKDNQRAAEVIQRLRSMLKKQKPQFELLDINETIRDTVALITTDIIIKNKVLKTDLDSSLPLIRGDRIQLQQVLLNLIGNGLEAMEVYKGSLELLIRASRKNARTILVEVKDSGCGVAQQNLNNLFEHFFTTKAEGLGMWLAISRSIIEEHGGKLHFKNNPGGSGATFYFTLPVPKKNS